MRKYWKLVRELAIGILFIYCLLVAFIFARGYVVAGDTFIDLNELKSSTADSSKLLIGIEALAFYGLGAKNPIFLNKELFDSSKLSAEEKSSWNPINPRKGESIFSNGSIHGNHSFWSISIPDNKDNRAGWTLFVDNWRRSSYGMLLIDVTHRTQRNGIFAQHVPVEFNDTYDNKRNWITDLPAETLRLTGVQVLKMLSRTINKL